jgi:hypothetical protein
VGVTRTTRLAHPKTTPATPKECATVRKHQELQENAEGTEIPYKKKADGPSKP